MDLSFFWVLSHLDSPPVVSNSSVCRFDSWEITSRFSFASLSLQGGQHLCVFEEPLHFSCCHCPYLLPVWVLSLFVYESKSSEVETFGLGEPSGLRVTRFSRRFGNTGVREPLC